MIEMPLRCAFRQSCLGQGVRTARHRRGAAAHGWGLRDVTVRDCPPVLLATVAVEVSRGWEEEPQPVWELRWWGVE